MPEGIDPRLEQLARRRAQLLAALPSSEGAVEALRHVVNLPADLLVELS